MNDKDKEAFEKWMKDEDRHDGVFGNNNNFTRDEWVADKSWKAACEYKQKEIDDLKKQIYVKGSIHKEGNQKREMTWQESSDMMERIVESQTKRLEESIKSVTKLKAELREYKEAASSEVSLQDKY